MSASPTLDRPPIRPEPSQEERRRVFMVMIDIGVVLALIALGALVFFSGRSAEEPETDTDIVAEQPAPVPEPAQPAPEPAAPQVAFGTEEPANWDVTGIAAGEELAVYDEPGVHHVTTGALAADTIELESTGRIAFVDGTLWREIKVPGATSGWVNARYLTEHAPPAAPQVRYAEEPPANWDVTGVSVGDRLNVRSGPGVHNPVVGTLTHDTVELESTGRIAHVNRSLWREIKVPGATSGWVNARYLTTTR